MTDIRNFHHVDRKVLGQALVDTALRAGAEILKIYDEGFEVDVKADTSPVTAADAAAESIILAALREVAPDIPIVAEEEAAAGRIPECGRQFFLVDPLDGTKEFIQRRGDFTVNIALIEDRSPTMGVVYAPAKRRLFFGDVSRKVAWTADVKDGEPEAARPIGIREVANGALIAVASKSHNTHETDAYLGCFEIAERVSCGSSLKFCLVAAGEADLYPRLAPTMEWDTAAGDAVLRAAGGKVCGPDGQPMLYGKDGFFNPGFVAHGNVEVPPCAPYLDGAFGP